MATKPRRPSSPPTMLPPRSLADVFRYGLNGATTVSVTLSKESSVRWFASREFVSKICRQLQRVSERLGVEMVLLDCTGRFIARFITTPAKD